VSFDAERGMAEIASKNGFGIGDRLELVHPSGNSEIRVERLVSPSGDEIQRVPGSDHRVWLPLPADSVGAFVARFLQILPKTLKQFRIPRFRVAKFTTHLQLKGTPR